MKFLIDTNVFLRFLIPSTSPAGAQKECTDLFSAIEEGEIEAMTISTVYAELVWTLQSFYKLEKSSIAEDLETFIAHGIVTNDAIEISQAVELYKRTNKKFIDCLIASHRDLQSEIASVVSYDHDFDALGVKRLEPKDVIVKF